MRGRPKPLEFTTPYDHRWGASTAAVLRKGRCLRQSCMTASHAAYTTAETRRSAGNVEKPHDSNVLKATKNVMQKEKVLIFKKDEECT